MVDEWLVVKNTMVLNVSKLLEVSGNFPEVSGNFPEVSRNVQQFPKVSGSFLPASRVHRAGCTEGEGGDQVSTAQDPLRRSCTSGLENSSLQLTVQGSGMAEICPKFASRFGSKFALQDPPGSRVCPQVRGFQEGQGPRGK